MSRITELNDELQAVRNQKDYLARHGGDTSEQVAKEAEILRLIAEGEQEAKEAVIEGVAQDITSSIETFTVGDITFTLDQLVVDEDAADILRSGLRTISKAQAQKFLEEIESQKAVYESQLSNKQSLLDHVTADRDTVQNANAQLQLERDDLSEKRDAAATQLLEAQAEITRLNSHVDDLRKEIAVGATNAPNVIDITSDADLEAAAQRLKAKKEQAAEEKRAALEAAKIPVYDVKEEYRSQIGTIKTFKFAENGEAGEIIWTNFNLLYRVMSDDEVQRFRAELEATKQAEVELVPEADKPVELVDDFRNDLPAPDLSDAHGIDNVVGNEPVPESDENSPSGSVTRVELENRLRQIKEEVKAEIVFEYGLLRAQNVA